MDSARAAFERSLALHEAFPEAHLEMAQIYFSQGLLHKSARSYANRPSDLIRKMQPLTITWAMYTNAWVILIAQAHPMSELLQSIARL